MASNLVKLVSSDNKIVEVDVAVAMESAMVKDIIEAQGIDKPIPLPNVLGDTLTKVMDYCKYHVESQKSTEDKPSTPEDEIKAWKADFVKVDEDSFSKLMLAADYLRTKDLMDLACETFVTMLMAKTPEEVQDFTNMMFDILPK